MTESNGLQQNIANRGGFDRTGDDLASGRICCKLIE
jgi:hypothetical protein